MSLRLKLSLSAALCVAGPVHARNILIVNDDGLSSNVKALYDALKAEGHDVLVSVPCQQQSGMGAALKMLRPLGPLETDCVNGAARVGDPGAGPMTRPGFGPDFHYPDFHYVDGTPVMATLYGLDVAAQKRWGRNPDLVLSGPNIGQNAGNIVISSGTVGNAQYAMMRGIPAIALSAGENTASGTDLINPRSTIVARRSLELLHRLEAASKGNPLLPLGVGLNVNFPDEPDDATWHITRIGNYMRYDIRFVEDLAAASGRRQAATTKPGLTVALTPRAPRPDQMQDEAAVVRSAITVSVMQIGFDAPATDRTRISKKLKRLVGRNH